MECVLSPSVPSPSVLPRTSTKNSGEIRIVYEDVSAHAVTRGDAAEQFDYYPSQMYICLYYDTTLVLKRSGVLFAD